MTKTIESPNVAAQNEAVAALKARGFKFGLLVGDAFVRGIRDLGYKNNAYALDELIDNSIQAGAGRVDVLFGFEGTNSDKKPKQIAIADNGHGMTPDMIRLAMLWGGTHREGDRTGMGRYGYGLPSACVSIGKRFTVYSKVAGGEIYAVTVDLDAISRGEYNDETGEIVIPEPQRAKLPKFVASAFAGSYPGGWQTGTVVVIDDLDRIEWTTVGGLRENLLRNFGVTYHKLRDQVAIHVGDTYCQPIDPLFLTPGFRYFDLEGDIDRAVPLEPAEIEVKDPNTRQVVGKMIVRYSYMPMTFASVDKRKKAEGKNANERFNILKDYHGVLFSRMGRLIGSEMKTPFKTFQNNDRYVRVEVEFPAALDELFGITTSKQQVTVSERIWDILKQAGVPKAIKQMVGKVRETTAMRREQENAAKEGQKRAAEEAMEAAKRHLRGPSAETKARQDARGRDQLEKNAQERANQSGRSVGDEQEDLELVLAEHPFKVVFETLPGGLFFRADMLGGTKILYINRAHRFYQDVYDGPTSSPEVKSALEVLLFAIGDSILDAPEDTERVYRVELPNWSTKLDLALENLSQNVGSPDDGEDDDLNVEADDDVQAEAA